MKVWLAQAFLSIFLPSITLAQLCQKFVDCPADSCSFPEHGIDFYTVTLAWLSEQGGRGVSEFDQNFDAAVALLKSLGDVSTDDDMIKHMTGLPLVCSHFGFRSLSESSPVSVLLLAGPVRAHYRCTGQSQLGAGPADVQPGDLQSERQHQLFGGGPGRQLCGGGRPAGRARCAGRPLRGCPRGGRHSCPLAAGGHGTSLSSIAFAHFLSLVAKRLQAHTHLRAPLSISSFCLTKRNPSTPLLAWSIRTIPSLRHCSS